MYAVIVTFQIEPDALERFLPTMLENATTSLRDELDCLQFDVCTDPDNPHEVFLYELYTDRAAFDVHLASEHFKTFDAIAAPMIASKEVRCRTRIQP